MKYSKNKSSPRKSANTLKIGLIVTFLFAAFIISVLFYPFIGFSVFVLALIVGSVASIIRFIKHGDMGGNEGID